MIMRLVAGSGRSGTTWILDALATANGLRPVFEPLHPLVSKMGDRFAHKALSAVEPQPELETFLDHAIHHGTWSLWTKYRRLASWLVPPVSELTTVRGLGQLYRRWTKFLGDAPALAIAGMRREPLVKCIYANLMLGWLCQQYKFRIVLVLRHPGAVIESELRGGWNPAYALDRFRNDAKLHQLTGDRYRPLIEKSLNAVEGLAVRWVIENQVALEQAASNRIAVVFYERLKNSPEQEWKAICAALELERTPAPDVISRPSQQSSSARSSAGDDSVDAPRWMSALPRESISQIQNVLDESQFDLYSMRDPLPRLNPDSGSRSNVAGSSQ